MPPRTPFPLRAIGREAASGNVALALNFAARLRALLPVPVLMLGVVALASAIRIKGDYDSYYPIEPSGAASGVGFVALAWILYRASKKS